MTLDLDGGDADRGDGLTMTAISPVVLATPELHDRDLARPALPHDLAPYTRPAKLVGRGEDLAVAVDEKDRGELHRSALVTVELLDVDDLPGRHAVLLASGSDHGFHGSDLPSALSARNFCERS